MSPNPSENVAAANDCLPEVTCVPARSAAGTPLQAPAKASDEVSFLHKLLMMPDKTNRDKQVVSSAKYMAPVVMSNLFSPRVPTRHPPVVTRKRPKGAERWREKGVERWPRNAALEMRRQPGQFERAEEVVPLQRVTINRQGNIHSELWTRTLRTKAGNSDGLGVHSNTVTAATIAEIFNGDDSSLGADQALNSRGYANEWVDRPLSTGRFHIDHMGGTRYQMDMTPRLCVPDPLPPAGRARRLRPRPSSVA